MMRVVGKDGCTTSQICLPNNTMRRATMAAIVMASCFLKAESYARSGWLTCFLSRPAPQAVLCALFREKVLYAFLSCREFS